jgi:hypothetical protein
VFCTYPIYTKNPSRPPDAEAGLSRDGFNLRSAVPKRTDFVCSFNPFLPGFSSHITGLGVAKHHSQCLDVLFGLHFFHIVFSSSCSYSTASNRDQDSSDDAWSTALSPRVGRSDRCRP